MSNDFDLASNALSMLKQYQGLLNVAPRGTLTVKGYPASESGSIEILVENLADYEVFLTLNDRSGEIFKMDDNNTVTVSATQMRYDVGCVAVKVPGAGTPPPPVVRAYFTHDGGDLLLDRKNPTLIDVLQDHGDGIFEMNWRRFSVRAPS